MSEDRTWHASENILSSRYHLLLLIGTKRSYSCALVPVTLSDIVNSIQSFKKIQYVELKKIASAASLVSIMFISFCQNEHLIVRRWSLSIFSVFLIFYRLEAGIVIQEGARGEMKSSLPTDYI